MTHHPGPNSLHVELLTRSELAAVVEHLFYRLKAEERRELRGRMPDAYARLMYGTALTADELAGVNAVATKRLEKAHEAK